MTIIIAGLADFGEAGGNPLYFFYEQLADVCTRCSDIMQVLAFVILFAGMMVQVYKGTFGGDLSGIFKHLLLTGLIISIIPFYAEWFLELQVVLGDDLLEALEVDPISLLENFGTSFAEAPFDTGSAPDIVFGIIDPMTWFEYFAKIIGAYAMVLFGIIMYACFYVGFQIQIVAIYLGCAAGPLFLAMLLFEPTRDSAVKYHVGMVGICFWPLGWGLGMLFGEAMMEGGTALMYYITAFLTIAGGIVGGVVAAIGYFLIIVLVITWMLVTLFGAPKVVQKAVTSGAQIGMSLVQGGISTGTTIATTAISSATQMASGAAMAAGGVAITAATGGAGAMAGVGMVGSGLGSMAGGAASAAGGVGKAISAASAAADKN